MGNEIRVRTSIEVIQDVGDSAGAQEGITYINKQLDGNADSRTWGGKVGSLFPTYTDADVAYWKQVVVTATSFDGLDNSDWTEASAVTDGTLPAIAHAVAIEYTGELGTVGNIDIVVSAETFISLDLGEGVVIPMFMGEALASITIKADNYSNGVNEATVNVMVVGV